VLPEGRFVQDGIIDALYIDSVLAGSLNLPLAVDYHVWPLIDAGNARIGRQLVREPRAVFQHTWLELGLPDAGSLTWEDVHASRESAAGRDYREMIARLIESAKSQLAEGAAADDLAHELARALVRELVEEVYNRRMNLKKAGLNLALNFIPHAGLLSSAMDFRDAVKQPRTWVTLLGDGRERAD
jgi:hypothetical protein